jgi:hypothetical protein
MRTGSQPHGVLSQGDGQFRTARGSPIKLPEGPGEMVLQDLNGDGRRDLVLASHESYGVTILMGDGGGGFAPAPHLGFQFAREVAPIEFFEMPV